MNNAQNKLKNAESVYRQRLGELIEKYENGGTSLVSMIDENRDISRSVCREQGLFSYDNDIDYCAYVKLHSIGVEEISELYEQKKPQLSLEERKDFEASRCLARLEGDLLF